jgi:ribonuclease HI
VVGGSSEWRMGCCGCRGILRGSSSEWLGGFAKCIGVCSVLVAEMWGALEVLHCPWRMGFRKVKLCMNSMHVVNMLRNKEGVST